MIRRNILKSNFMKAALFGLFLSTFSTGAVFAKANDSKDISVSVTAVSASVDKELSDLQSKIDQYVFVDHAEDIKEKNFMITNTGVMEGYVEVGILPYSEDNAKFITDVFGTDKIKVVEGVDNIMYALGNESALEGESTKASEPVISDEFDSAIFDQLDKVNNLLFEVNAAKIEAKGLAIMSTAATATAVEIGILPYTEENAAYIYDIVGKDLISVVEGKEPELMATSGIAVDPAVQTGEGEIIATAYGNEEASVKLTGEDIKAGRSASPIVILSIAGVIVLLGGTAYVLSNKKAN